MAYIANPGLSEETLDSLRDWDDESVEAFLAEFHAAGGWVAAVEPDLTSDGDVVG